MKIKNKENLKSFDINMPSSRPLGISAMMRVGNEEEFIRASILSTVDFFDEIIVVLNNSTDRTEEIVRSINSPKIKIYYYPFQLRPNGPGHKLNNPDDSVYSISYYYNWCLSKTTKSHVCKWDGDNVAISSLTPYRDLVLNNDIVYFRGTNIVGEKLNMISKSCPYTAYHPSFHIVKEDSFYTSGDFCEQLNPRMEGKRETIKDSIFLHYKACKSEEMQTRMWPKDWKKIPHFKNIYKRFGEGLPYTGPQPKEILNILKKNEKS